MTDFASNDDVGPDAKTYRQRKMLLVALSAIGCALILLLVGFLLLHGVSTNKDAMAPQRINEPIRYSIMPYQILRSGQPGLVVMVKDGWGYDIITKVAKGYIFQPEGDGKQALFIKTEDF